MLTLENRRMITAVSYLTKGYFKNFQVQRLVFSSHSLVTYVFHISLWMIPCKADFIDIRSLTKSQWNEKVAMRIGRGTGKKLRGENHKLQSKKMYINIKGAWCHIRMFVANWNEMRVSWLLEDRANEGPISWEHTLLWQRTNLYLLREMNQLNVGWELWFTWQVSSYRRTT